MRNFKEIEELPRKKSIFPDWFAPVFQKWLPLAGVLVLLAGLIVGVADVTTSNLPLVLILAGFAAIIIGVICNVSSIGSHGRETKEWLNEDGSYDMVTPRAYSKLNDTFYHRFAYLKKKNVLEFFAIDNENIYLETKDGTVFQAPLSEVDVTYFVIKGNTEVNTVVNFKLSSGEQYIQFSSVNGMLEDEEYQDIYNLLLRAKSFAQTKKSKIFGILNSAAGLLGNGSDGVENLAGSLAGATRFKVLGRLDKVKKQ